MININNLLFILYLFTAFAAGAINEEEEQVFF